MPLSYDALVEKLEDLIGEIVSAGGQKERTRAYFGVPVLANPTSGPAPNPPAGYVRVRLEGMAQLARFFGAEPDIVAPDMVDVLMIAETTPLIFQNRTYGPGEPHDLLDGHIHSDTVAAACLEGAMIYGDATPDWNRLVHPGAANRVLQSTAAQVGWSANAVTFPAAGAVPVGTGANTQVAYWTGANTIAGDAGMVYNAATDTLTIAGDIDPSAASGQDLGDATHRWDLYTQEVCFNGATGANAITLVDNLADALHVVDAGDGDVYLQIVTTTGSEEVIFNAGGDDVDFTVQAVGVADALQVQGSDGQITLGMLVAGIVQATAGGVLSSDYTLDSTVTMASGQDFDPADASGQDLGDATHRWDLYTQGVFFNGATGANIVTLVDNLADAFHVIDAGDGDIYLRIVTTTGSEAVIFNDGGDDVDFIVEAVGHADALVVQGSDGQITLGVLTAGYVKSNAGGVLSVATEVPLVDLGSYTQGDLIYGGAADWQDLAHPGAANRVLQSTAAEVGWSAQALVLTTALTNQGAAGVLNWGGVFTLTVPATGTAVIGGGAGAANRVAYWSDANTLTSDAGLLVDAANDFYIVADGGGIAIGAAAERIVFDAAGYVSVMGAALGVGTLTPGSPLHIYGVDPIALAQASNPVAGAVAGWEGQVHPTGAYKSKMLAIRDTTAYGSGLTFWTTDNVNPPGASYTEKVRITSAGYTGFGTTPSQMIHVLRDDAVVLIESDADDSGCRLRLDAGPISAAQSNAVIDFYQNGVAKWQILCRQSATIDRFEWTEHGTDIHMVIDTGGNAGFGGVLAPAGQVHVDQSTDDAAIPVLILDQADIDVVLMKVIGSAAAAGVDFTLVADSDFGTPGALVGWIQVEIQDDGDRIADGDYYLGIYAAPS